MGEDVEFDVDVGVEVEVEVEVEEFVASVEAAKQEEGMRMKQMMRKTSDDDDRYDARDEDKDRFDKKSR